MAISRRQLIASGLIARLLSSAAARMKIVVAGGHPGDPECGCGGTIARYASLGHDVVLAYLNRGEGFCNGSDVNKCGTVRTAEAKKACQILKVRAAFANQIDGRATVDDAHYQEFRALLEAERPDVLFTQWPIDQHRDHRAVSMLVLDAWLKGGKKQALYYYEVADDTMMFSPAEYVDISAPAIVSARRAACYAHVSQQPEKWYPHQDELTRFRGSQSGYAQAEGFVRHWESRRGLLP